MVKITVEEGEKRCEMEGQAVVACIIRPTEGTDDRNPDAGSIMIGGGKPIEILEYAASCLGSVMTQIVKDPMDQMLVSLIMMKKFREATMGKDIQIDVQEQNIVKKTGQEE